MEGRFGGMESALEQAIQQVSLGRKNIAAQRLRILATMADGDDPANAQELLRQYEKTLANIETHLMDVWSVKSNP